ncbi:MAG: hypothetical protein ACFFB5_14000 [Promethearchaeota archaeon]
MKKINFKTLLNEYKSTWEKVIPEDVKKEIGDPFNFFNELFEFIYFEKEWPYEENKAKKQKIDHMYNQIIEKMSKIKHGVGS